jgi:hypothetical protein
MAIEVINAQQVVGDLRRFDRDSRERMQKTLFIYAKKIEANQIMILRKKVKNWTGRLASTIEAEKIAKYAWKIGPNTNRANYAEWVESGRGPVTPKNAEYLRFKIGRGKKARWVTTKYVKAFAGYFYVRDSVKKYRLAFIMRLKRDIEESV